MSTVTQPVTQPRVLLCDLPAAIEGTLRVALAAAGYAAGSDFPNATPTTIIASRKGLLALPPEIVAHGAVILLEQAADTPIPRTAALVRLPVDAEASTILAALKAIAPATDQPQSSSVGRMNTDVNGLLAPQYPLARPEPADRDARGATAMAEVAQRAAGLSALVEIGATLAAQHDYQALLATIDAQIARLIPSENAGIYLLEPDSGDLVAERLRREAAGIPERIPRGRGLASWVVQHGESLLSNDIQHDPRFYDITNRQSLPQAMLIAPLPGLRGSRGAICLARYSVLPFTALDRDLLTAFGQQAGVALDQAQRAEELAALNAIATATATLDLDQVLRELVARTRRLTEADACAIDLLDESGTVLTMRAIADAREARTTNEILPFELSASAKIIHAARPLLWSDAYLGSISELSGPAESVPNSASLMGAPLIAQGRIIGTVLASRLITDGFKQAHLRFLETVAAQAAVAVENARMHAVSESARSDAEQRAAGMAALVRIGAQIAAQHDYDALIDTVDREIAALISCDSANLLLVEPETGDLVVQVIHRSKLSIPSRVPQGQGLSSWVMAHGEPLVVNDVPADARIYTAGRIEPLPKRMLLVPLPGLAGPQGVIVLGRLAGQPFTPLERDLLAAFGQQVGAILEQARLRETQSRRSEELAALNAIAKATASLDLDEVLQELATRTRRMMEADHTGLVLIDADTGTLMVRAASGRIAEVVTGAVLNLDDSFAGAVIRARHSLLWHDAELIANSSLIGPRIGQTPPEALIGTPLIVQANVIGVLLATSSRAHTFTERHLRLLETIATQAAIAVENARLYAAQEAARGEAEQRAAGMAALVRIGTRIAAQQDYATLLDTIDEELDRLIPSDNAAIFLREPGTGDLVVEERHRRRGMGATRVPRGQGISTWVLEHGSPLLIEDAHTDPRLYQGEGAKNPPKGLLLAPLPGPQGPQGVITLGRYGDRPFTTLDRDLLAAFGQQIGAVLDQTQLRTAQARRSEELAALNAIAKATASLDLDEVLQELVVHTRRMLAADTCAITLLDEAGATLTARAADGLGAELLVNRVMSLDRSFSGEIIASPHALLWHDTRTSPHRTLLGPKNGHTQPASMIGVPLIAQERTIGAMIVTVERPNAFTEDHLHFAQMVGNQATIAVENARLYAATLRLARYDPLTGLANRRYFIERLGQAVAAAARYGRPLALLVIDIDRFKTVNDTYGHLAGDAVLCAVGERLRKEMRQTDFLARYAGDELAIILPETDVAGALVLAERLRESIAAAPIPLGDEHWASVTLSIGAGALAEGQLADELLHAADDAMYNAKQTGRNRVCGPAHLVLRAATRKQPLPPVH